MLCLLLFSSVLRAQEQDIFVQLDSAVELIPMYVGPIEAQDTTATSDYLEKLRQVLLFDLNHNGATRTISEKEANALPSLKDQGNFDAELDFKNLKADGVLYIIKLALKGTEIRAKVISINAQTGNTVDRIAITGDLPKDRVKVHMLADAIHKILFGKPGIASCRILYTVKKKVSVPKQETKWVAEVNLSDYDGANTKQLTQDNSLTQSPLFIPPTTPGGPIPGFIYVSYKIGQPKIYEVSFVNGIVRRVSILKANQVTPALTRDGGAIAFACDVSGRADIFLQPMPKGTEDNPKARQIFTAKGVANASPSFSPDGKQIAFVSDKDGSPKVYVMKIPPVDAKLTDIKLQLISKRNRENSAPAWSPDGKKLAYCARNSGERQIWIYDFETGIERQLTKGKAIKENPAWAADSLHLLFNATDDSGTNIYLINLNQPDAVKITSGPGDKLYPSWEPKNL